MKLGESTIAAHSLMAAADVTLFSTWFCPYAQRAWIALEYKQVDYKWVNCVLYEGTPASKRALTLQEKSIRTPGFVECSPRGLVPGLQQGSHIKIHDSLPVIEYIEEAFPSTHPLLPPSPAERAKIRIGISLWNETIIRKFYSMLMSPSEDWEKEKRAYLQGLEEILPLFSTESPFFSSHGFSLFECACLPWFQRTLSVLKLYREFAVPVDKFKRIYDWYEASLQVQAFQNTIVDETLLIDNYIGYANNSANNNRSDLTRGSDQK